MDFTNEINTLESEKLRLEEMLKRNNDRLQLLKEVSTKPHCDGYRRFFKLKGYSLLYTGGERAYGRKTLEIMYDSKKRPHKIVIYCERKTGMSAIDLDANTYK